MRLCNKGRFCILKLSSHLVAVLFSLPAVSDVKKDMSQHKTSCPDVKLSMFRKLSESIPPSLFGNTPVKSVIL